MQALFAAIKDANDDDGEGDYGDGQQQPRNGPKPSALDLITSNFDFVQEQYREDYEKQDLIGYKEALRALDQFVNSPTPQKATQNQAAFGDTSKNWIQEQLGIKKYCEQEENQKSINDQNFPLILTGDEGCGKTHTIIKWLMRFNEAKPGLVEEDENGMSYPGESSNSGTANQEQQKKAPKKLKPNVNVNGDVVFTYFAGIESINSRVQIPSVKPPQTHLEEQGASKGKNFQKEEQQQQATDHTNKNQAFIYNILTKIRALYKIDKRVEILDDQLRTNFREWLEMASKKHDEMMDKTSKIILVLDGPENFTDENGIEQSADWIPVTFPERFKVIILARQKSKSMRHFIQRKYPMLILKGLQSENDFVTLCDALDFDIEEESDVYEKIKSMVNFKKASNIKLVTRELQLSNEAEAERILAKKPDLLSSPTFVTCLVLFRGILNEIKDADSISALFKRILIHHYDSKSPVERQIFLQILLYLSNTRKGLIVSELEELLVQKDHFGKKEAREAVDEFVEIFDFAYTFSPVTDQLMSQNPQFVQAIPDLVKHVNDSRKMIRPEGDQDEEGQTENLRVTYGHHNVCKNICSLIEQQSFSLRQIDELVFQYQKAKNWQRLKDLISSIEVFSILYNPETKHQLAQYWQLLEQYKYDPVAEYNKSLEGFVGRYQPNNQEIFVILLQLSRFLRELADFETQQTPQFKHPSLRGNVELKQITLLGELDRLGSDIYIDTDDKNLVQQVKDRKRTLNVDNPITREVLKQELIKDIEKHDGGIPSIEGENIAEKKSDHQMLNYYYKRWLWVQFPWWCINPHQNVSEIMELSVSLSNLRPELLERMTIEEKSSFELYFSMDQEKELVLKTLNILKDAKLRKAGDSGLKGKKAKKKIDTLTVEQTVNAMKQKERQEALKSHDNLFSKNNLSIMKAKMKTAEQQPEVMKWKKLHQLQSLELQRKQKNRRSQMLPPLGPGIKEKTLTNSQSQMLLKNHQVSQTYSSALKQQAQLQKARQINRANSAMKAIEQVKLHESGNDTLNIQSIFTPEDQMVFFDIRKQLFFRNNSFSGRPHQDFIPKPDGELDRRQKKINDDLRPSKVIGTLKSRLQDQSKNRIKELEAANLKWIQILNQKQFAIKKLREEISEQKNKFSSLKRANGNHKRLIQMKQCEQIEQKLLVTHETLNSVMVSKQRMDQILAVLLKNPANDPDFTAQLTDVSKMIRKLIVYENQITMEAKNQTDNFVKEINFTVQQISTKIQKRDLIYQEIGEYLEKISTVSKKNTAEEQAIRAKILQIKATSDNDVQNKVFDKNEKSQAKVSITDKGSVKNLEDRLKYHQQWHNKLMVSSAFLNEKKNLSISQFKKLSEVTGVHNPSDLDSLTSILDKSQQMKRYRIAKESQLDKLKEKRLWLQEKMQKVVDQLNNFNQGKLEDEIDLKTLKITLIEKRKLLQQKQDEDLQRRNRIAASETNLNEIATKLFRLHGKKPSDINTKQDIEELIPQMIEVYKKIERITQGKAEVNKTPKVKGQSLARQIQELDTPNYIDFALMGHQTVESTKKAMEKKDMMTAIDEIGGDSTKPMERLDLAREIAEREEQEFQERLELKYKQNAWQREEELNQKLKKEHEELMKNVPLFQRGNSFDIKEGVTGSQTAQGLNKTLASGIGLDNPYLRDGITIENLPKFKTGTDIDPIIAIIRQGIKNPISEKTKLLTNILQETEDAIAIAEQEREENQEDAQPTIADGDKIDPLSLAKYVSPVKTNITQASLQKSKSEKRVLRLNAAQQLKLKKIKAQKDGECADHKMVKEQGVHKSILDINAKMECAKSSDPLLEINLDEEEQDSEQEEQEAIARTRKVIKIYTNKHAKKS